MIDQTKKYRTRDGKDVRVYAVDGAGPYPVHGAIFGDGQWEVSSWAKGGEGVSGSQGPDDLFAVREKLTVSGWLNLYRKTRGIICGGIHPTEEEARGARCGNDAIACVHVTLKCEEGDGL